MEPSGTREAARPWQSQTDRANTDDVARRLYDESANDREIIARVSHLAGNRGVPMAQVALAWVLHKSVVTAPTIGARKVDHLNDAEDALALNLSDEDLAFLEAEYTPRNTAAFK